MRISGREAVLFLATGAVLLFSLSFFLIRSRIDEIRELDSEQRRVGRDIVEAKRLLEQRESWEGQLRERGELLPQFPADKKMDVHWLSVIDSLASQAGVNISRRRAGEEKRQGDVYEMSVECEWEASLDSLVRFLFELQNQGVMLDTRQLFIKPKEKTTLRGNFRVDCVYTRGNAPSS